MHNADLDVIGVDSAESNGTFCVDTKSEFPFAISRLKFLENLNDLIENKGKTQKSSPFWKFVWSDIADSLVG